MSEIHFEKLTPVKNAELNIYGDALNFVFKDKDIKNVAISGAYSAGKSSVIESYKYKHKEHSFLHISLANFESTESDISINESNSERKDDGKTDAKENNTSFFKANLLEGKILNQLLHQIDVSKIQQTNFRVKQAISENKIFSLTMMTIFFLICILHLSFISQWREFVNGLSDPKLQGILVETTTSNSLLLSGLTVMIIVGLLINRIISIQKNKNIFKRFSVQGNEIEIYANNDESYFDKYLNEVLYLFDNSDADVIVFEDMDRFNVNQIFQRLREVNTLINSKREKENKKPLRFFYLLRDDIFISKDRTKFFDFIMPVVPVIDSSNSYDQFISHFKKGGVFEKFDEHFLQGISLYVDDMRILKNIYNEFMVYYKRIGTTEQDYDKLLAMVVYKNIFPRDFSETQLNNGFVSTILSSREDIIKEDIVRIEEEILELQNKIIQCDKEHLQNIEELGQIIYRRDGYGRRVPDVGNPDYIKRRELIELKQNNEIDNIQREIKKLELEKNELKNKNISKLITRENADRVFNIDYKNFLGDKNDFKEIKSSPYFYLVKYLVWNGYIDETYEDYMTYFYPNSLTTNDKTFLRSVADKKAKEWTYKIDNSKLVLSRLRVIDFDEIETLNFDLFTYLLSIEESNKNYLFKFMGQLKTNKRFSFVERYYNITDNVVIFVKALNRYWSTFLKEIFPISEFPYQLKKNVMLISLYHCDNDDVDKVNEDNFLTEQIASDKEFLAIDEPDVEKLINEFLRLGIKFKTIDYGKSNKDLFQAVYQNKLYEFTYENIASMLVNIFNVENEESIKYKNYSLVMSKPKSELLEYINDNIDYYMSLILENCDSCIRDDEDVVLSLINNSKIELAKREKYVEYLQTSINLLEEVQETVLWDPLLEKGLIVYSEENILQYYFESGKKLSDVLIRFINSDIAYELRFSKSSIEEMFGEDSTLSLIQDVIISKELINEKYKNFIAESDYVEPNFTIEEIQIEKVKILIELGTIKMTAENVEFIRRAYAPLLIDFLNENINEYIENVYSIVPASHSEIVSLLSTEIEDKFKLRLIDTTDQTISIMASSYSDEVKRYILENNFDETELIKLVKSYGYESPMIKDTLIKLCIRHIDDIISENVPIPLELFDLIIIEESLENEKKLILLSRRLENLSKEDYKNYFKIIGCNEHIKIFGTGRPKLEFNEANRELLSKFKSRYWISDFREEKGLFKISRSVKKLQNTLKTELL